MLIPSHFLRRGFMSVSQKMPVKSSELRRVVRRRVRFPRPRSSDTSDDEIGECSHGLRGRDDAALRRRWNYVNTSARMVVIKPRVFVRPSVRLSVARLTQNISVRQLGSADGRPVAARVKNPLVPAGLSFLHTNYVYIWAKTLSRDRIAFAHAYTFCILLIMGKPAKR